MLKHILKRHYMLPGSIYSNGAAQQFLPSPPDSDYERPTVEFYKPKDTIALDINGEKLIYSKDFISNLSTFNKQAMVPLVGLPLVSLVWYADLLHLGGIMNFV